MKEIKDEFIENEELENDIGEWNINEEELENEAVTEEDVADIYEYDEECEYEDEYSNECEDGYDEEDNYEYVSKKPLKKLVMLVAFVAIMLVTSTYAWFSMQKNVTIGNLKGIVNVVEGLEISLDAKKWSDKIDFSQYADQTELKQIYGETEHNIIPTEMLPVSTNGKDGIDKTDITMYRGINTESIKLGTVEATSETVTDPKDNKYLGYYAIDIFIKNSSKMRQLDPNNPNDKYTDEDYYDVLQLNEDSLVTIKSGGSDTTGLQNTVRVALALYNATENGSTASAGIAATQSQILAATTGSIATIKDVAIWEPNSSSHEAQIVANNNRITWNPLERAGYIADQTNGKFTATEKVPTYALKSAATAITGANQIENIYDWSGKNSAYLEKQVTLQTTKATNTYYIEEGVQNLISVNSTDTATYPNGATGEVTTFKIPKNQISRLRMYVWLEGQDVDCTNLASHGGGIEVNLGLVKDEEVGYSSGIKDYVPASAIFDKDGTNPEGLHIGDFVSYDAGTWTQAEIDAIKTGSKSSLVTANGSTSKPSTAFRFGGFIAESSRNETVTPGHTYTTGSVTYGTYVQDKSTGEAITGWRVFDVNGDKVTLISAGNPENYYHAYGTNYAYISEYILTGNVNTSWSGGQAESTNYQKRDWSNYINTAQKAESAIPLTKSRLDNWYTKYTNAPNANTYTDATF